MTFPKPLPDYKPGELEKIEAAEAKRRTKEAKLYDRNGYEI